MSNSRYTTTVFRTAGRRARLALLALCTIATTAGIGGAQSADYVIGPQDVLSITVFNQPKLAGKYAVDLDGSFSFPLIGRVKAGGLTIRGIEGELSKALSGGFLNNPQVTVTIEQYRSQRVLVTGEVKNAGPYALTGDMTLIEALAKAGSTTSAAADEVIVVRGQQVGAAEAAAAASRGEALRVNLRDVQSGRTANVELRDGDTVYVPPAEVAYVYGQVKNPAGYPIRTDTTVLQVLAMAGGVTPFGAANRIKIVRTVNGEKKELKVKLTDLVRPGDTIVVPERYL